jgi:hypothetical protein
VLNNWKMVKALLNKKSDDAVGVKYEVRPLGIFVSDHAIETGKSAKQNYKQHLGSETHVKRAISCGVCGKVWTFSKGTSVETVAVGFCFSGR